MAHLEQRKKQISDLQEAIEIDNPPFGADFSVDEHKIPGQFERYLVDMLQLHVPKARQTHEILFMPRSETCSDALFVTQLSESILIRIGLIDGKLDHRYLHYWSFGPESKEANHNGVYCGCCEPHNLSQSPKNPGCFYLSLQVPNVIYLMDAWQWNKGRKKFVRSLTIPPTDDGQYGTPHVVREHPQTGDLWIGMKGGRGANPAGVRYQVCECCDDRALANHYDEFYSGQQNVPIKYGVCKVTAGFPRYTGDLAAKIYECEDSPPMLDFLKDYVYVSQDRTGAICRIDQNGKADQMPVKFPDDSASKTKRTRMMERNFTGPGIVATPGGEAAWCALLGHQASMVRIDAESHRFQTYHFPELQCRIGDHPGRGLRFIHFAFHDTLPKMYILSSSLLEPDEDGGRVADAVVIVEFEDSKWRDPIGLEVVPLPTQQSQAHRIVHVCIDGRRSLFVTEFTTSAIVQILDPEKIPLGKVSASEASSPTTLRVLHAAAATQAGRTFKQAQLEVANAEAFLKTEQQKWFNTLAARRAEQELTQALQKLSQAKQKLQEEEEAKGKAVEEVALKNRGEEFLAAKMKEDVKSITFINLHCHDMARRVDPKIRNVREEVKAIAAALPSCTSLTNLTLESNHMGDEGAKAIAAALPNCRSLQELTLVHMGIRDEGAKAIAAALPNCRSLQELILDRNRIRDEGAKAIAAALPSCSSLKKLWLTCNEIGDDGLTALKEAWRKAGKPEYAGGVAALQMGGQGL